MFHYPLFTNHSICILYTIYCILYAKCIFCSLFSLHNLNLIHMILIFTIFGSLTYIFALFFFPIFFYIVIGSSFAIRLIQQSIFKPFNHRSIEIYSHLQDNIHTNHQVMDMLRNRNEVIIRITQSSIKRWIDDVFHHLKSM